MEWAFPQQVQNIADNISMDYEHLKSALRKLYDDFAVYNKITFQTFTERWESLKSDVLKALEAQGMSAQRRGDLVPDHILLLHEIIFHADAPSVVTVRGTYETIAKVIEGIAYAFDTKEAATEGLADSEPKKTTRKKK